MAIYLSDVPRNKYGNRKAVSPDGKAFDSRHECNRYCELRLMQRAGVISGLECQKRYELIPAQRVDGKVVEKACTYIADFVYQRDGKTVVKDAKGCKTEVYRIKRKLMLYVHGIQIVEV